LILLESVFGSPRFRSRERRFALCSIGALGHPVPSQAFRPPGRYWFVVDGSFVLPWAVVAFQTQLVATLFRLFFLTASIPACPTQGVDLSDYLLAPTRFWRLVLILLECGQCIYYLVGRFRPKRTPLCLDPRGGGGCLGGWLLFLFPGTSLLLKASVAAAREGPFIYLPVCGFFLSCSCSY